MDFREAEHIQLIRETLRRFVETEMPREAAARWDAQNSFPRDVFDRLADLGVMGLTVPEEYGGSGRDIVATMAVIEELAKRSLAVAVPYIMAACYGGMNVLEVGSDRQKADLLPKLAAGQLLVAYAWTEPDVGSDLASVTTTARRDGDRVIINGSKRFCTGGEIADYLYTLVKSDRDAPRYRNLSFVLVPRETPGITIERIDDLGMHGAAATDITYDDVAVPFDLVMGEEAGWNSGWPMLAGPGLDVEKLEVAAMALGLAEAATLDAWDYSQQRVQFGSPIATQQSIRHLLADCKTKLLACRLMLSHAAWLADTHQPCSVETSMAKLYVCDTAKEIVLNCQTILGAYGYVRGFDLERYVRDVLLMPIIGGTSAIQKNNIVNRLKLPR